MCKCAFLPVLMLLLTGGCWDSSKSSSTKAESERSSFVQKITVRETSDGLVLVVGGETVTSDKIIESPVERNGMVIPPLIERLRPIAQITTLEQFKRQARAQLEEVLTNEISNILLYQHAKGEMGKNVDKVLEMAADRELRKFVLGFGGDQAKADEALKQMDLDRNSYKEHMKRLILFESYKAMKLPKVGPITYKELIDCYNGMKEESFVIPARLRFRLIDIEVAKLKVADPNQSRQEKAGELANELMGRLRAGEDFVTSIERYSQADAIVWRVLEVSSAQSLAKPYDILAARAENIEPGEIAEPIEAEGHIFIMELQEKRPKGYEPFEKVQRKVREKIIFDRRKKTLDELNAKLLKQAELGETDQFVDFCLGKIYRMSNQ